MQDLIKLFNSPSSLTELSNELSSFFASFVCGCVDTTRSEELIEKIIKKIRNS